MTMAPPPPQRVKHDHHHFNTSGNNSGLIWDRVRFGRGQRQESDNENDSLAPPSLQTRVGGVVSYIQNDVVRKQVAYGCQKVLLCPY